MRYLPMLLCAMLSTGCAYTRIELEKNGRGTTFVTSANIRGLKLTLTRTSATLEAANVNHSVPTKEIGNNIMKGFTGAAGLMGGAAAGL